MGYDRRLKSVMGQSAIQGSNIIIPAIHEKRIRVYAFLLETISTTAVTAIFYNGENGNPLWQTTLCATLEKVVDRSSLTILPPIWLFETSSAQPLVLNLSATQTVNWSIAYWDDENI